MAKRATLAEIMGTTAAQLGGSQSLSLKHLPKILGESMPELPRNSLGRHRLVRSLQQRFGNNWRALPGVKDLVREFDSEILFEGRVRKMKAIRGRR